MLQLNPLKCTTLNDEYTVIQNLFKTPQALLLSRKSSRDPLSEFSPQHTAEAPKELIQENICGPMAASVLNGDDPSFGRHARTRSDVMLLKHLAIVDLGRSFLV